jgi:hypothetical protein
MFRVSGGAPKFLVGVLVAEVLLGGLFVKTEGLSAERRRIPVTTKAQPSDDAAAGRIEFQIEQ